jgi:hypothetical protein|tara:strand:+ start:303 stop:512 length:210 start_codon:yes stop_codon:yes gene_type:complete
MTRKDFIKLADSLGTFKHYLLNDDDCIDYEFQNLINNIKLICKQSNENFKSHLFERKILDTFSKLSKNN